jgi:hypothetical protein
MSNLPWSMAKCSTGPLPRSRRGDQKAVVAASTFLKVARSPLLAASTYCM